MSASELTLDAKLTATLDAVLDCIIPPSPARGLPGASEVGVWSFITRFAAAEAESVRDDLAWIDAMAREHVSKAASELDSEALAKLLSELREAHPGRLDTLGRLTMSCYYQHDAVLQALGDEPRAPYPLGFKVEPGDLSLLEPVRQRGPIYRDA